MILYRGSLEYFRVIQPENIHKSNFVKLQKAGIKRKDRCIWATSLKEHAIVFAIFSDSVNFELETKVDKKSEKVSEINVIVNDKNWRNKIDLSQYVYIYKLNSKDFVQVTEFEWVAFDNVTPSQVNKVKLEVIMNELIGGGFVKVVLRPGGEGQT